MPASATDVEVLKFAAMYGLTDAPVILAYQDEGYDPIQCHISAKAHALKHGGKRVHGWALWELPDGLIGEFHSVWEDASGALIDITPPRFGSSTMFIRDRQMDIYPMPNGFVLQNDRRLPPHQPFWHANGPATEQVWGFVTTAANFVCYCRKVGLSPADFATDPTHG
jgi:hypothetical protein